MTEITIEAPTPEVKQEPVAIVDANDEGYWADILPDRSVKVGQPLFAYPPDAQAEIAKRDARIETLEIRLSGFSDLTGLMQSSLEGDTSRISELLDQNEKQASEIARLKAVIAKCKETISGMQEWFEAEDNHAGTTFYERMDMCKNVQVKTVEALAAIKEEGL